MCRELHPPIAHAIPQRESARTMPWKTHHVGNDAVRQQPDICEAGPNVLWQNRCDRLALVEVRAEAVVPHTPNHDVRHCKIHTALSMSVWW